MMLPLPAVCCTSSRSTEGSYRTRRMENKEACRFLVFDDEEIVQNGVQTYIPNFGSSNEMS